MGIIKKLFNQTRKPEGILGKMILKGMNSGHAKLKEAGFSEVTGSHHYSRPWITVLAKKQSSDN